MKKPATPRQRKQGSAVAAPSLQVISAPAEAVRFPIVGIGASAGGLAAFEAFFSGLPATTDPGMAFVLVQHLAPDHKSMLCELIRRYTRMAVFEVEDGMAVRPNCVYIIPPGCEMAFLGGVLQLLEPCEPRGQRLPVDFFFRSLAQDQHERAIGIILSGTGSDGTQGVRAIKADGGMIMVQNPASTEFDGMPRSALATGLVDYELPPAEMGAQLMAYAAHAFGTLPKSVPAPQSESAIRKIFILLRAQTGHDFSQYKPSTIHRRIERRMAVHQINGIDAYAKLLQQTPAEVEALFRDLLIGVTNFFRDPDAFQTLEQHVIPKLFNNKPQSAVIRELTVTLRKAIQLKDVVQCPGLRVKTNGHFTRVNLMIRPVITGAGTTPDAPLYLVILEETTTESSVLPVDTDEALAVSTAGNADAEARIAVLKADLRAKEEHLQSAIEELESSTEELKSSNEEMQSVNEEMQSTNEELETSKEELQSVNEELATVNTELQTKVMDLSRANNDMNNLLAGTGIGTVFVDHDLHILRFTPAVSAIINLIPTDVGRPVSHIVSNLVGYTRLVADVKDVLNTLVPRELEVGTVEGKHYNLRIQPYRTLENVIEGAVITFTDITEMVKTREALKDAKDLRRLAVVVRDSHDAITVQDLEGRIIAWNPGAVRIYGWSEAEALALNVRDRTPVALRAAALDRVKQLSQANVLEPYRTQRLTKAGTIVEVSMISTALVDAAGKMYAIATTERECAADTAATGKNT